MIGAATSTATLDFYLKKTVNAVTWGIIQNASTGTAGIAAVGASNSGNSISLIKSSTGFTTAGLAVADQGQVYNSSGGMLIYNAASSDIVVAVGGSATTNEALRIDSNKNVSVGNAALATNATNGFLYLPTCAGTPTGVPTAKTGRVATVYDTTNNKLYVYNGAWKGVTLA
jgi:fructose-specific component phosphotransferase system IIB-like protein